MNAPMTPRDGQPQSDVCTKSHWQRRELLKSTLIAAGVGIVHAKNVPSLQARGVYSHRSSQRPRMAAIGTGSRWAQKATGIDGAYGSAKDMQQFGDYVAVCDADQSRMERASLLVKEWTGHAPIAVADYRELLQRTDIDVVHISTPDHWHAKMAIEAMLAGKDVYCEKPMTLTVAEGILMSQVCRKTGRVVQIGTQQRSDPSFLTAIALIRAGRIGKLIRATCGIGGAPTSPAIPEATPPAHLDWNRWLGPAPDTPFRYQASDNGETKSWSRAHYEFRWWYEYSGGKLTDWGAHHVDIATWAMGKTETGPVQIHPLHYRHPVPFRDGYPVDNSQYNTATEFKVQVTYEDGLELIIQHDGPNGILFEGSEGRIFVNRGRVSGKAVDDLKSQPLAEGALESVYKGRPLVSHFKNFFEAIDGRYEPISDVFSHHRALTTCHLAGIAVRLGEKIEWDPKQETIPNQERQRSFLARESRNGFGIEM